jgi:hypothetical protein
MWRRTAEYYRYLSENPNYQMAKYEDIVSDPETTLREICGRLKIDYRADLLDSSLYTDQSGQPWTRNSSFESSDRITTDTVERWRDVLSQQEIDAIEYTCGPDMAQLGYQARPQNELESAMLDYREDPTSYPDWIRSLSGYEPSLIRNRVEIQRASGS